MLLYGAARDPATCKPTKDSEIAAARAPRLRVLSSALYSGSLAHTCSRDPPHCLFFVPSRMFLSVDRSENTANGQYRNVFTAIWSQTTESREVIREKVVAASSTSEECFLSESLARQRHTMIAISRSLLIAEIDLNDGRAFFSRSSSLVSRTWSISRAMQHAVLRADGGGKGLFERRVDRTPYNRLIMSRRFPAMQRPIQSICR